MSKKQLPPLESVEIDEGQFKKISRRRLLTWSVLSVAGLFGIRSIATSEDDDGLPWPLRKINKFTDGFWNATFSSNRTAAKTPVTKLPPRINGDIGMNESISKDWRLHVTDPAKSEPLLISLEEIKSLPAVTENFEFKCIEGWSRDVTCKGVRFSDFMKKYGTGVKTSADSGGMPYSFASLTSVNGEYYVSMDIKSLLHPQTLLCYEMNGQELTIKNGYPLRLITPVKYGVKNIKQIGAIAFTDSAPADYWAEQGYGEYLGL